MDHFAGLDVSVKDTSVCIVDETGRIVREVKVASEPEALLAVLTNPAYHLKRIGLEAGPLSQWLFSALAEAGLPVICVETRHMRAVLKAQINKTDRNDARGIAQMMRVGLYRPVHVKTLRSQKLRMLLPSRPREFHPEPLTDSGREPLDSSGSCHRAKAAAFHCSSGLYEDAIVKGVFCWCLAILIALGYGYRRAVKPRSRLCP